MTEIENVYIRTLLKSIKMFRILLVLFFINLSFGQQIDKVDFTSCHLMIDLNSIEKTVNGGGVYEFEVLKNIDTIRIDAVNMEFENVSINHKNVKFKNNKKELILFEGFNDDRKNQK